jgi:hypothetical protein
MRRLILLTCLLFVCSAGIAQQFRISNIDFGGVTVAGDFNRDGWPDLAIIGMDPEAGGGGSLIAFPGTGGGDFGVGVQTILPYLTPGYQPSMLTADINGDGILDLVITNDNMVMIFYGDGHLAFSEGPTLTFAHSIETLQLGDLNGDGRVDMVVAEYTESGSSCSIETELNAGGGNFTTGETLALSQCPTRIALADINGDGKLDLLVSEPQTFVIWPGLGNGSFKTASHITPPRLCTPSKTCSLNLDGFALSDFYNNGLLHLAMLQSACNPETDPGRTDCLGAVYIYKNSGSGLFSFAHTLKFNHSSSTAGIAGFDLNGDQKPDVLVNKYYQTPNGFVFLGNGNGTFGTLRSLFSWNEGNFDLSRDLQLSSRQDVVGTAWLSAGLSTEVALNTTPVVNCPPPRSGKLAARICSPTAGASPATFVVKASGNSPAGVQRVEVWIDGKKKAESCSDQLSKKFTLSAGTHKVTVVAVDKYTGTAKSSVNIMVP